MGHFGLKIKIFEHFSKSVHQIFLKLYLLAGIEKQVKVTGLDLKENSYYAQNRVNGSSVRTVFLLLGRWNLCTSLASPASIF